ncbi:MAG: 1,4-dihydroxy-2-naphthoate octaprenyltransferase [Myxococcota bacterium]|nr:1,4-dihydroxy-2-naphthoate octaprenyltransferase [Myxococcota bacterium]
MRSLLRPWLLAFRPKTLTAAVVPVAVGTCLAKATHNTVDWLVVGCAVSGALFIQMATNLFNDALDFKKGSDTGDRIGPLRVTQAGLLSPRSVIIGGVVCLGMAAVFGVPLIAKGGIPIAAIGVLSLIFAVAYTGGPFPLAYKGLGDVFVLLFFGLIAVGATHYLHTLDMAWAALVAGAQVGAWAAVLLAVNNLRDVATDITAEKKTLPVRFGIGFGRAEIAVLAILPFVIGAYWWQNAQPMAALLPLAAVPFAAIVIIGTQKNAPGPIYNRYLAKAAALHFTGGALLAVGLWLD